MDDLEAIYSALMRSLAVIGTKLDPADPDFERAGEALDRFRDYLDAVQRKPS